MSSHKPHICMFASENDVLPGAKVGGIGDVVRDVPAAVAALGASVSVVTPAYGRLHRLPGATLESEVTVEFAESAETVEMYEVYHDRDPGVRYLVLHHPAFAACGAGSVYCDDERDDPFSTDATKFALFGLAGATFARDGVFGRIDVLHCHDWHAAFVLILRTQAKDFESLKKLRTVHSIHNLALQGIRPFAGHQSSLRSWFPNLAVDRERLGDPRWSNCINPMASAIRLADRVHAVSPNYAREIVEPNAPERGFHGGEGLEHDLQRAADEGRLVGILNGIHYEDDEPSAPVEPGERDLDQAWTTILDASERAVQSWMVDTEALRSIDYLALTRVQRWRERPRPPHVVTSVGRLTDQKMALLMEPIDRDRTALDAVLERLADTDDDPGGQPAGVLVLLGSGDRVLERQCREVAGRHANLLFVNGYSGRLADALFAGGDLFIMPSSFEPCGISQMLAMREAQPCVVHAVGGLVDTIEDGTDGFRFSGDSMTEQAQHLVERFSEAIDMRQRQRDAFDAIAAKAATRRFSWRRSAERYLEELYA